MKDYDGRGVDDDYVARAAKRIVRRYHLEQNDHSEDSAQAIASVGQDRVEPDNIHALRLAIDDVTVRLSNMERLLAKREDLFLAGLERVERNLAKSDGLLDALVVEVAKVVSAPKLVVEDDYNERRWEAAAIVREVTGPLGVARAMLDEAHDIRAQVVAAISTTCQGADRAH